MPQDNNNNDLNLASAQLSDTKEASSLEVFSLLTSSYDESTEPYLLELADDGDPHKDLPLHAAVLANDDGLVELSLGLDTSTINDRDNLGKTALHLAVEKGHSGIVELLLKSGADVNLEDADDNTALASGFKNNTPNIEDISKLFKKLAHQAWQIYDITQGKFVTCTKKSDLYPPKNNSHKFIIASLGRDSTASLESKKVSTERKRKSSASLEKFPAKTYCPAPADATTESASSCHSPGYRST